MKKLLACLLFILLTSHLVCAPLVFAETTTTEDTTTTTTEEETTVTTTEEDTTATTTTEGDEETTTTDEETTTTTVDTPSDSVKTKLIILEKDGKISARLTDENGYAVAGVTVGLQLGSTILPGVTTDENGYADFRYTMPADMTYIYCYTDAVIIDGVLYEAAGAAVGRAPAGSTSAATDAETDATTTAIPTYNRTTKVTTSRKTTKAPTWYTYTATTAMEESYISLGFSFDSGILSAFNTDEKSFSNTARLLLSADAYTKIIGDLKGTLLMTAAASATEVTDEQIAAALQNDAVLSLTNADKVERVVMDLSLQLQSNTGKVTDVWTIAADSYVIQLPIPQCMRSAKTIAVSAVTADGISEPVYATVSKDGFLRFETTSPVGTIVLLGFKGNLLAAFTGDSAVTAIVFMVLGILCIGGAVFLYVYFIYLPKKGKKKEAKAQKEIDEKTEEQPTDVFDEIPLTEGNERIDPLGSLDIFNETDTDGPTDGGHHTNIDIPL